MAGFAEVGLDDLEILPGDTAIEGGVAFLEQEVHHRIPLVAAGIADTVEQTPTAADMAELLEHPAAVLFPDLHQVMVENPDARVMVGGDFEWLGKCRIAGEMLAPFVGDHRQAELIGDCFGVVDPFGKRGSIEVLQLGEKGVQVPTFHRHGG